MNLTNIDKIITDSGFNRWICLGFHLCYSSNIGFRKLSKVSFKFIVSNFNIQFLNIGSIPIVGENIVLMTIIIIIIIILSFLLNFAVIITNPEDPGET